MEGKHSPAAWGEKGASALSRHNFSSTPWAAGWREEVSPALALAGNQACLAPRGHRLSLEGMGRWFSSLAWPLLCFLGSGNLHFLFFNADF